MDPVYNGESAALIFQDPPKPPKHKSSLSASAQIIVSLLFGIAFAIGHDRYNHFLDGRRADAYDISQEWVSRIETAFAFLVNTSLAATVAAAYAQRLWRNVKSDAIEVGTMDALMAAPTDMLSQLNPRAWLSAPGMLLMGTVIWCLPLAAVIAPGSLTVIYSPVSNVTNLQVAQLDYSLSTWYSLGPSSSDFEYWSASAEVQRTGFSAATAGQITGASHMYDNQSYTIDFPAPAVRCVTANDTVRAAALAYFEGHFGSGGHLSYISWVGNDDHGLLTANSTGLATGDWSTLDITSTDAARLFVYSTLGGNYSTYNVLANVTECVLHNATYTAVFSTAKGVSQVTANRTLGDPLPAAATADSSTVASRELAENTYTYQSVMDVFGKLLVGYASAQNSGSKYLYTSFQRTLPTFRDLEQTQTDLETLFQNMTLSMFSNTDLLQNSTKAAMVPVTVTVYPLTYRYLPKDLWIAYGVAAFVTLITALVGLHAAWASGLSYSSKFSTAVRIAKYTRLYSSLPEDDDGSDPLPKSVAVARVGGLDTFTTATGSKA